MKHRVLPVLLASAFVAFTSVTPLTAQSDATALEDHMRQVRRKVAEKRNSAVSTLIELDKEQRGVFRQIEKAYDKDMKQLGKKERDLLRDFSEVYDGLDAETADTLGQRFFALQRERLGIQETYLRRLSDKISPVVAVQFLQLQRRFEAELETERLKYSPLAE